MKNFLKENWFKLMTGTSMLVFSFAFLMYAVSPSYANQTSEVNKPQMESKDDAFSVASGGYLYTWASREAMRVWGEEGWLPEYPDEDKGVAPFKRKLP
jgi:hypothetical protein